MKLRKLTAEDLFKRLEQDFTKRLTKEVDAIRAVLDTSVDKELFNQEQLQVKSLITSLNESLDVVRQSGNEDLSRAISTIQGDIDSLNVTGSVTELDSKITKLNRSIYDLKYAADEDEECEENAQLKALQEQFDRLEERMRYQLRQPYAMAQVGGGAGSGGAVKIYGEDENGDPILINDDAKCIQFKGEDVLVTPSPDDPDCVTVYIPPPTLTVALTCPPVTEVGTLVDDVNLSWVYNQPTVVNQILTGGGTIPAINDDSRAALITMLNEDRVNTAWTIKADDPVTGVSVSDSCSLYFGSYQYWAKAEIPTTSMEVKALANKRLVTGKDSTINFAVSGSPEYMIFCYAAAYGVIGKVLDPVTGFEIPVVLTGTVDVTADTGYITPYNVYRSFQKTAGSFTWSFNSNSQQQLPPSL